EMRRGSLTSGCHVDLTRLALGVSNELENCPGRHREIYHHDLGHASNARDRRDVADEIEIELLVKRRVHRVSQTDKQERMAVRHCPHDALGADIAAGACSVLNAE